MARHATTLERLEPGSLLVAFSRRVVLELKGLLEMAGRRVSVVYGPSRRRCGGNRRGASAKARPRSWSPPMRVGMGLNLPAHTLCFYTDENSTGWRTGRCGCRRSSRSAGAPDGSVIMPRGKSPRWSPMYCATSTAVPQPDDPVDLHQFQVRPSLEHLRALSEFMERAQPAAHLADLQSQHQLWRRLRLGTCPDSWPSGSS